MLHSPAPGLAAGPAPMMATPWSCMRLPLEPRRTNSFSLREQSSKRRPRAGPLHVALRCRHDEARAGDDAAFVRTRASVSGADLEQTPDGYSPRQPEENRPKEMNRLLPDESLGRPRPRPPSASEFRLLLGSGTAEATGLTDILESTGVQRAVASLDRRHFTVALQAI